MAQSGRTREEEIAALKADLLALWLPMEETPMDIYQYAERFSTIMVDHFYIEPVDDAEGSGSGT
jgi:hypothetical protein